MAATISAVSRRLRTMIAVLELAFCEIGKNTAASGSSLRRKYFPSATVPTIWIDTPSLFLK
jgi:hypothetical protein